MINGYRRLVVILDPSTDNTGRGLSIGEVGVQEDDRAVFGFCAVERDRLGLVHIENVERIA